MKFDIGPAAASRFVELPGSIRPSRGIESADESGTWESTRDWRIYHRSQRVHNYLAADLVATSPIGNRLTKATTSMGPVRGRESMPPKDEEAIAAVLSTLERSDRGAPAVGGTVRDRFGTNEIYQRVVAYGDYEFLTGRRELFFSALAGGFAIAVTFLLYASLYGAFDGEPVLSHLLYPLGFMFIILGGYQLYTENTLPPVTLVLERLASIPALLAIFGLVLLGNVIGASLGGLVLANTGVLSEEGVAAGITIAETGLAHEWWDLFFKALFAGFIVAGVVWMDFAADSATTRLVLIYLAFLAIPVAGLYHVVVSVTELVFLILVEGQGLVALGDGLVTFILPVFLGNTIGGILLVTIVNWFQTTERRLEAVRDPSRKTLLSPGEILGGSAVGRSYIPPKD